ncbi:hypothetical protein GG344DRAFT_77343 [Lentinula edodes]|nr:hypothetical protein GG344DRAFT_77343 [Lentinula edodes]
MVHSRTVYTALFAIAGSASSVLAVPISSSSSSSAGSTSSTLAAIATTTTSGIGIAPASTSSLVVPSGSVPNSRRSEAVDVFVDNVNKFEDGEEDEEIENESTSGLAPPIEEDEEPLIPKTPSALDSSLASDPTQPTSLRKKLGNGLKTSVSNVLSGFTTGHGTPGAPSVKPGNPSSATN